MRKSNIFTDFYCVTKFVWLIYSNIKINCVVNFPGSKMNPFVKSVNSGGVSYFREDIPEMHVFFFFLF